MKNLVMILSTVAALTSCGRSNTADSSAELAATVASPVVVDSYGSRPVNGGINPMARANEISVSFRSGSNPCMATMHEYAIKQITKGSEVHIIVTSTPAKGAPRACTMQFQPVYASLSTTVYSGTKNVTIIVDNVTSMGKNVVVKL